MEKVEIKNKEIINKGIVFVSSNNSCVHCVAKGQYFVKWIGLYSKIYRNNKGVQCVGKGTG